MRTRVCTCVRVGRKVLFSLLERRHSLACCPFPFSSCLPFIVLHFLLSIYAFPPSIVSLSPPLPVMPVVSNYHSSVFLQPLHYIQAVITVYLQHLLPFLGPHFSQNKLFYMSEMTALNRGSIDSPLCWRSLILVWLKLLKCSNFNSVNCFKSEHFFIILCIC